MPSFKFPSADHSLPEPADREMAARNREEWHDAIVTVRETSQNSDFINLSTVDDIPPDSDGVFSAIFGNSPYLSSSMIKEPEFVWQLLTNGPDTACDCVMQMLDDNRKETLNDTELARLLRIAKRRVSLAIAAADICGVWPLSTITGTLSDFASKSLSLVASHLLLQAAGSGAFELPDPDNPEIDSGLVILGMGKLGARELNYSSDIDLIILFDPEVIKTDNPAGLQNSFIRLARNLVKLMDERTADGYVFRTDLRLRPDPSATPLAVSVLAAETYYESLGQNWERAAMIKARPVAGDIEAGNRFLKWLTPFIWRKNLDFAAIQDIHSIKRQINARRGGSEVAVAGHNVKLGAGGIREVEFFAQTQQLIWGGREAALRSGETIPALRALTEFGVCTQQAADDLSEAYQYLRRVEHRIQMTNDEQTHDIPNDPEGLLRLSIFLGYATLSDFEAEIRKYLTSVQHHYTNLFAESPSLGAAGTVGGSLVFTGSDSDPDTLSTLREMGYQNPETVDTTVRSWHHGRHRSTRSTRARELLTELMPMLLSLIAKTPDPDTTFIQYDKFLAGLPSGVQLFSMFHSNPQLLTLVVEIMGVAPRLAEHLSRRPSVLDGVLAPDFFDPPPDASAMFEELERHLARAEYMEDILNITRRWSHDRRFQIGVQQLQGLFDSECAGRAYSDIAETTLKCLYPRVVDEFTELHGTLPGGSMALLALGKLGGREMSSTSDLDMVFIYKTSPDAQQSDGEKPLSPSLYYARLSQRLINAVTAVTPEGTLYELDMRLRPSGNKGPIACTLESFRLYHTEEAWTWEHMAMTRARLIISEPQFAEEINSVIDDILCSQRDRDTLRKDIANMRLRLAKEKGSSSLWALKQYRGGLVDIEFITQYIMLRHAHAHPEIISNGTASALQKIRDAGLMDAEEVDTLLNALKLWQELLGMVVLAISGEITPSRHDEISGPLAENLIRVGDSPDLISLETKIETTAQHVYQIFNKYLDSPSGISPEINSS